MNHRIPADGLHGSPKHSREVPLRPVSISLTRFTVASTLPSANCISIGRPTSRTPALLIIPPSTSRHIAYPRPSIFKGETASRAAAAEASFAFSFSTAPKARKEISFRTPARKFSASTTRPRAKCPNRSENLCKKANFRSQTFAAESVIAAFLKERSERRAPESGKTLSAAAEGVGRATSAAMSASELSVWCPIPVTTGTGQARTALTTRSSSKTERSSLAPPPRVRMTHSTPCSRPEADSAVAIRSGASKPWTRAGTKTTSTNGALAPEIFKTS